VKIRDRVVDGDGGVGNVPIVIYFSIRQLLCNTSATTINTHTHIGTHTRASLHYIFFYLTHRGLHNIISLYDEIFRTCLQKQPARMFNHVYPSQLLYNILMLIASRPRNPCRLVHYYAYIIITIFITRVCVLRIPRA